MKTRLSLHYFLSLPVQSSLLYSTSPSPRFRCVLVQHSISRFTDFLLVLSAAECTPRHLSLLY